MPENDNPQDPKGGKDPKDPKKPDGAQNTDTGSDEGKGKAPDLTEEKAWDVVLKSDRWKEQNRKAKLADKLQKEKEDLERQKLEEEGKHKELAEKEKARADAAESRIAEFTRKSALSSAASKAGFVDPNDAAALIDPSKVKTDDDGNVTNADALVADLAKAKPHLVGKKPDIGSGGSGGGDTTEPGAGKRWKQSEIRKLSSDPENGMKWWEENKKEILAAQREGRIDLDG